MANGASNPMALPRIGPCLAALAALLGQVSAAAAQPPADLDCEHFATRADAQLVLDDDRSDPYDLDPDGDGVACNAVAAVPPPTTGTVGYAVPSDIAWPIPARVGALTTPVRLAPGSSGTVAGPALAGASAEILGPIQVQDRRGYVPIRTGGVVGWVWIRYLDPASIGDAIPFAPMATIADAAPPTAPAALPASPPEPVAPAPSPEPIPAGITADEAAYLAAMQPVVATMSDSMRRVGLLLQNPLPGDPTWSNRVTAHFAVWDQSSATADALVPPESLRPVHETLAGAFRVYAQEGPVIAAAIAAGDTTALADSAARLAAASAQVEAAREQLDAVQAGSA